MNRGTLFEHGQRPPFDASGSADGARQTAPAKSRPSGRRWRWMLGYVILLIPLLIIVWVIGSPQ